MPGIVELGRFQFAMTTVFHFFFVPLSIGLAFCVALMETFYVRSGNERYRKMAKFWGKIFLLSFSVGVVTGIIQEFQFGMNWSGYSRFVGDIFGAPLAIEALLAFFLESTFLGIWMFSWERVSKGVHCLFIWLVTIGSMLSALWILIANSFMQHPQGYEIINGRAQLTDFGAVISNPQVWYEYGHVLFAALALGSFFVMGSSAIQILKNRHTDFFQKSIKSVLIIALIASLGTIWVGDKQMRYLIREQPMKFAATEGLYKDSGDPAPWTMIASIDERNNSSKPLIQIPGMLSVLSYGKPAGSVQGMETLQKTYAEKYGDGSYYPPVAAIFWSFRLMAGFGMLFCLIALIGLFCLKGDRLKRRRWFLWLLAICTFLPFVSTTTGWLVTELGRFPWTVYGLFTIAASISPNVSATSLLITNIIYFLLFAGLAVVLIVMMARNLKKGPEDDAPMSAEQLDPFAVNGKIANTPTNKSIKEKGAV